MLLWLRDLSLAIGESESLLAQRVAAILDIEVASLDGFRIVRRSLDARKKGRLRRIYTVEFAVVDGQALLHRHIGNPALQQAPPPSTVELPNARGDFRALVVGMGPAGLFAAKALAEAGAKVTLVERGRPVEQRVHDVESFWTEAKLDPTSNVQFGEGGAGTFSDGKLTSRLKHPWRQNVLETLVRFGAQDDILIEARPHVGTDRLRRILINFRRYLLGLGVDIRFTSCLTDLEVRESRIVGGIINDRDLLPCEALILAPGHSARDTYEMLYNHGVRMEPKGFAIGARVEHRVELINAIQYGNDAKAGLPTADYSLRYNNPETGRGVYSFCMCPGGEVINAASEPGGVVVNGMSCADRSGPYSNSALVVSVAPDDWGGDVLGGIAFQRHWERLAFEVAGSAYRAPAQNLMAFAGKKDGSITSSCRPGIVEVDLRQVLPGFVAENLCGALPHFDRQMRGFLTQEAVLIGVETRTSAPLRIMRNEQTGESVSHPGLYPAGEGAGYAGGIMSAALDGLRIAQQVLQNC